MFLDVTQGTERGGEVWEVGEDAQCALVNTELGRLGGNSRRILQRGKLENSRS